MAGEPDRERLQKVLARAGVASRRAAEDLIASGRVHINGIPAVLGQSVRAGHDQIVLDGHPVALARERTYLALNKPKGVVSTARATRGERTVLSLVDLTTRLYPVGRLDRETHGLLLLSNDGDWTNVATHPRHGVEKEYEMLVCGIPSERVLERLRAGVVLPTGETTAPAKVKRLESIDGSGRLSVTVIEGKKRQLRLMAESVGHPILDLMRVRIGSIRLGSLPIGSWRHLTDEEVEGIRARQRPGHGGTSSAPQDRD